MGVYMIKNIINNKIYIGSSFNVYQRWKRHLNELKQNKHHSLKLQRSYNKYGINNFVFEILEICSQDLLSEREQFWINHFNSYKNGYNVSFSTTKPMLGRKHTEETKKIMSEKRIGIKLKKETKEKLSSINKGKKYDIYTEERNTKISKSLKGRKSPLAGIKKSKDFIEKHYKKINQFTKDGCFIQEWESISHCAKFLKIDVSSISKVCLGKLKSTSNFKFSYAK